MPDYRIVYNGYGANRAIYREQEIQLHSVHDWSRSKADGENIMLLVHKNLQAHFSRYDILLVEKIN